MLIFKTPRKMADKPHNESSYDSEDKIITSNEYPRPKHDKSDVDHHFLDFYFAGE